MLRAHSTPAVVTKLLIVATTAVAAAVAFVPGHHASCPKPDPLPTGVRIPISTNAHARPASHGGLICFGNTGRGVPLHPVLPAVVRGGASTR